MSQDKKFRTPKADAETLLAINANAKALEDRLDLCEHLISNYHTLLSTPGESASSETARKQDANIRALYKAIDESIDELSYNQYKPNEIPEVYTSLIERADMIEAGLMSKSTPAPTAAPPISLRENLSAFTKSSKLEKELAKIRALYNALPNEITAKTGLFQTEKDAKEKTTTRIREKFERFMLACTQFEDKLNLLKSLQTSPDTAIVLKYNPLKTAAQEKWTRCFPKALLKPLPDEKLSTGAERRFRKNQQIGINFKPLSEESVYKQKEQKLRQPSTEKDEYTAPELQQVLLSDVIFNRDDKAKTPKKSILKIKKKSLKFSKSIKYQEIISEKLHQWVAQIKEQREKRTGLINPGNLPKDYTHLFSELDKLLAGRAKLMEKEPRSLEDIETQRVKTKLFDGLRNICSLLNQDASTAYTSFKKPASTLAKNYEGFLRAGINKFMLKLDTLYTKAPTLFSIDGAAAKADAHNEALIAFLREYQQLGKMFPENVSKPSALWGHANRICNEKSFGADKSKSKRTSELREDSPPIAPGKEDESFDKSESKRTSPGPHKDASEDSPPELTSTDDDDTDYSPRSRTSLETSDEDSLPELTSTDDDDTDYSPRSRTLETSDKDDKPTTVVINKEKSSPPSMAELMTLRGLQYSPEQVSTPLKKTDMPTPPSALPPRVASP